MKITPFRFADINKRRVLWISTLAIILSGGAFWSYYTYELNNRIVNTENTFASSTAIFLTTLHQQQAKIAELSTTNENLDGLLTTEQRKRLDLETIKVTEEKQIDTLTKLTTIDPELLKKYSKVYFLSENYIPARLEDVDSMYLADPTKPVEVLENMRSFLMNMLRDADASQVRMLVISGYRSFDYQKTIKSQYKILYGAGTANQFSAEQGYSEHQLGTVVDLGTPEVRGAEMTFQDTAAFKWLNENAYKYGFIISYPKENTFYQYEPWHWRFVGKKLAQDLHDKNIYFYKMDQRDIDTYLIKIFDWTI